MKLKPSTLAGILVLFRALLAAAATTPVYENVGLVDSPVIDATAFVNRGSFGVNSGSQPYETQNTLYYTNFPGALIAGIGGFNFGLVDDGGFRHTASDFYNAGTIRMGSSGFGGLGGFFLNLSPPLSWVLIDATNVVNRGGLAVDVNGLLSIRGDSVAVARSGLRAGEDPSLPISQGGVFEPFYSNDDGIQDVYGGAGVNNALDPASPGPFRLQVLTGTPASSGRHEVLIPDLTTNRVVVSAPTAFAISNTIGPTNLLIQAVFVNTNSSDPLLKTAVRWGPPRIGDIQGGKMAMVQFTYEDVDTITGEPFTNYVYVLDSLGALTNAVLYTNFASFGPSTYQRPSSYEITRVTPPEWDTGTTSNVPFSPSLFVNPNYAATDVTNVYAAYAFNVGPQPRRTSVGTPVSGGIPALFHPTNRPARIEIEAGTLDLNLTRFRSEGLCSIKADQLLQKPPYKVDSPVVRLDVASSNGPLLVSNIVQTTVRRFLGQVACWSGAWTNLTFTTSPDPNDPTMMVTNTIEIRFHALIVQPDFQTIIPVETLAFTGRAQDALIWDDLTVSEGLHLDAANVEIHSTVNMQSNEVTPETFPSLENLNLSGSLSSFSGIVLGSSNSPISLVTDTGQIAASTLTVNAASLENDGGLTSSVGDIILNTQNLKFEGGQASAAANLRISADDFKAQQSSIETGTGSFGALVLDVRNRMTDGGPTASNSWLVTDGFQMVRKPTEGDLLGTEVTSFLNRFREGIHVWAGQDHGPTIDGFTNNSCLGKLTLDGTPFTLFTFVGPDPINPYALYVDFLNLTNSAVDVENTLNIATNFTLYFADSNIPVDQLNGALGGRLQWVQAQAGVFSGVNVPLSSGGSTRVNRALLKSVVIDSDSDGIANAFDAAPFESSALRVNVRLLAGEAEVSWSGAAGGEYRVEYSTNLSGGSWETLTTCKNLESFSSPMKVMDSTANGGGPRFYRVVSVR